MAGIDTPAGSPADSVDADIASILTEASGTPDSTGQPTPSDGTAGQRDTPAQAASPKQSTVKLGGREYKSLEEADKAHRGLYGKFSEGQQLLNWFKQNLKDPDTLAMLAKHPEWGNIAAKLGLQQAQEDLETEEAGEEGEDPVIDRASLPPQMRKLYDYVEHRNRQFEVWRTTQEMKEEKSSLESELKRKITHQENETVCDVLERASSLSYKEAWTLANHDKVLKEAVAKASAGARSKDSTNRPRPIPGVKVPGTTVDSKKPVAEMTPAEWREHFKGTEEYRQLTERG